MTFVCAVHFKPSIVRGVCSRHAALSVLAHSTISRLDALSGLSLRCRVFLVHKSPAHLRVRDARLRCERL